MAALEYGEMIHDPAKLQNVVAQIKPNIGILTWGLEFGAPVLF